MFDAKTLLEKTKEKDFRENITLQELGLLKAKLCQYNKNLANDSEDECLNHVRILRNSCVNCARNQNILHDLCILPELIQLTNHDFNNSKFLENLYIVTTQTLANYISRNEKNTTECWSCVYPGFIERIFKSQIPKAILPLTMILYHCLKTRKNFETLLTEPDHSTFILMLHSWNIVQDSDWICLILQEKLLYEDKFYYILLYKCAFNTQQNVFLHLEQWLKSDDDNTWELKASTALCKLFCKSISEVIGNSFEGNPQTVYLMLKILCALSGKEKCLVKLQNSELLKHCIKFTLNIKKIDVKADIISEMIQSLIKIIGNLCYRHRENQDLARKDGIIPVIMNNCNINEDTPFVQQWAIFALRNLCEYNNENQQEIAKLEKMGIAENRVLSEMGISIHEIADSKFKMKFEKR